MSRQRRAVRPIAIAFLVCALGITGGDAGADDTSASPDWNPPIVPAPEPFSLNSYDAIDVVALLRRVRFLQHWDYERRPTTVTVRTVSSYWVGYNAAAYEGHQNRYDIMLNGEPIDWDHLYLEYDGEMINLRLLYTYRNQKPPPDLPYRLVWP